MNRKKLLGLLALMLMMGGTVKAEIVRFYECFFNEETKKVTSTIRTQDCIILTGENDEWQGLGEKGKETWYAVSGNVKRKTLNIFGHVHLVLLNDCSLTCTGGIKVEAQNDATISIYSQPSTEDSSNDGKLIVTNSYKYAAGIGAGGNPSSMGDHPHGGNVNIHGGDINVTGGKYGAGIGGGCSNSGYLDCNAGTITIYGGKVVAHGGEGGAGIGGAASYDDRVMGAGVLNLYGGEVTATGGELAAGVGGGGNYNPYGLNKRGFSGNGGEVYVYGGKLTAQGGFRAAGIGSGSIASNLTDQGWDRGGGGKMVVNGGEVYATGGEYGAGIGNGCNGYKGTDLTVLEGFVRAQGGKNSAGIGGGEDGYGGITRIKGGRVIALVGENCDGRSSSKGSAIGHGKGEDKNYGQYYSNLLRVMSKVYIDGPLKVSAGDSESNIERTFTAPERQDACEWRNFARIEACAHNEKENYTYIDKDTHRRSCLYCGCNEKIEEHTFDQDTKKCACGYKNEATNIYKYTIYKVSENKTYEIAKEQQVFDDMGMVLPEAAEIENMIFEGYYIGSTTPTSIERTDEDGTLYQPGEKVICNYHPSFYPRYRYEYDFKWMWDETFNEQGKTTVKLKIKNTALNEEKVFTQEVDEISEEHKDPTDTEFGERNYHATFTYARVPGVTYQFQDWESYKYINVTNVTLDALGDNDEILQTSNDRAAIVTINNLTLEKDKKLHPICLPFSMTNISGTPLEGAKIYEASNMTFDNHQLTMEFKNATQIEAGMPYFVKWDSGTKIENPTFEGVILKGNEVSCFSNEYIELWGTFDMQSTDEVENQIYVLEDDELHERNGLIVAFSNYFYIPNEKTEDGKAAISTIRLKFDNDQTIDQVIYNYWEGEGTAQSPFLIKTIDQLEHMAFLFNNGNANVQGKYFKQAANLTFDKTKENNFTPVNSFNGHYDGDGYVISGVNINASGTDKAGLFINVNDGSTVKNIILGNSDIKGFGAAPIAYKLLGNAIVENCHVLKNVSAASTANAIQAEGNSAGGVVGYMTDGNQTVMNCTSQAAVSSPNSYAGGIIGVRNSGSVTGCIYLGNSLNAYSNYYKKAIVGNNGGNMPTNCYYIEPTLPNETAKLMPNVTEDNTNFLTLLSQRDKFLAKTKTELAKADYNYNLTLNGRTFIKNGTWNTICLPFNVTDFTGTPLEGATVKTLESTTFSNGTLTMNFSTDALTAIEAGKPYVVKWTAENNSENPVFNNVMVSEKTNSVETDYVNFNSTFAPVELTANDKSVLYLGANNTLYYPTAVVNINAFFAYFKLNGITVDELAQGAKSIVMNFGDETTNISTTNFTNDTNVNSDWYSLDGSRLNGKPTTKGIYIHNGNKVVIK